MFPRLTIDLKRIRSNTDHMMEACRATGVDVMGVTKGVCGDVEVARVFVDGGVSALGDARLDHLSPLRMAGLGVPLWLIRSPSPREVPGCVAMADGSLQSDLDVVRLLSEECRRRGSLHRVILMVDTDTGREGMPPSDVPDACREVMALDGLELEGLGLYFDFKSTAVEQEVALDAFVKLAQSIDVPLRVLSGGASNVLELVLDHRLPEPVNHLRLGTAPLLGLFTSHGPRPIEGWERDTFLLEAEVIEVKKTRPEALLALGHADAPMEYLYPTDPGIELVRASSDHMVIRFTEPLKLGDTVRFRLGYYAMNRLVASRYTRIVYR
jgi:predicted amino acid racemase